MKKTIFLLIIFMTLGLVSLQAQFIYIDGFVTDETNGDPVPNQEVYIMDQDSLGIYLVALTNDNGYYFDSISTGGMSVNSLYVYTNDLCTFGIHDTLIQNPGPQVMADFQICVDSIPGIECNADFYYVTDSNAMTNTVYFYDLSTPVGEIDNWWWSFGDGNVSYDQNPVHTYADAGTYNVCLTIENQYMGGVCYDTLCLNVTVTGGSGSDCQADFYYTIDSSDVNTVYFYDNSSSTAGIETWNWSFGDGTFSGSQNPVHTFNSPGYYYVCLTITADSGTCSSTACDYVYIAGSGTNCQANFYDSISGSNPNMVYFYDASTPYGLIDSWFWEFGDGTTSAEQNPVHTYNASGLYSICLTITADSGMCTSTYCDSLYISGGGLDCEADFYYLQDSLAELTVIFIDQSTPTNTITSWDWSFGDGGTSALQNPIYQYSAAGTYNVCLTIESQSQGAVCYDTYCTNVTVTGGGGIECQADFFYTTDSNAMTNTVYFWDLSTPVGEIDNWWWLFGDGNVSYEQNPVHTYAEAGTYNVCLTIQNQYMGGVCYDTICMDVTVTGGVDQFQLGGNVFAGIYQLDQGFAYAYKSENGVITDVYSDFIDTLGYYLFYPLVAADYYVKVEPSPNSAYFNDFMPTYYGDVVTWEDAVLINLDQNIYTADINLVPMNQAAFGPGQIAGTIMHGTTLRDNTPAVDVQIMLANEGGEFVGLAYSDEDGKFAFSDLPTGTYMLYAEVTGITMVPGEFTLTEENTQIADISMIMTDDEIYFGPNSVETLDDITVSEIYPNPVSQVLNLDIGVLNPTAVTVRIVNQLGQEISHQQLSLQHGQTLKISTADLHQGMYFLEVVTMNNFRTARRFVKL